MKLNELIMIKNAIESIFNANETLPGSFEIKARSIIARILPEEKHLLELARKELEKELEKDQAIDQMALLNKANELLREHGDLELGLSLPRINNDDLQDVRLPRGAYDMLRPALSRPAEVPDPIGGGLLAKALRQNSQTPKTPAKKQ